MTVSKTSGERKEIGVGGVLSVCTHLRERAKEEALGSDHPTTVNGAPAGPGHGTIGARWGTSGQLPPLCAPQGNQGRGTCFHAPHPWMSRQALTVP